MKQTMPETLEAHLKDVSAAQAERMAFARSVYDATVVACEVAEGFAPYSSMWDVSFKKVMRAVEAAEVAEQKANA